LRHSETLRCGWRLFGWIFGRAEVCSALVEVGAIFSGEVGFVGGQVGFSEDCVLGADAGAVSAVDAFIGIDIDL
jgi:hypothetical protein